jgi:hypothetical protein
MTEMSQPVSIDHPDYRPGRGERRADREIVLRNEAADAYRVWAKIWDNRRIGEPRYKGVRQDGLEQVVANGGLLGDLVLIAVGDATTRPLRSKAWSAATSHVEFERERYAAYEMAAALRDRYAAVAPVPVSLVPAGYADETCAHGRRFDTDCPDCEV